VAAVRAEIRVLLVDDHPAFLDALEVLLARDARIRVVGRAANGHEAIQRAHFLRPDIVTMDIEMPVLDGVGATRALMESGLDLNVILVSASAHSGRAEIARAAGAAGYVTKSRASEVLVETIVAVASGLDFVVHA
jgi:DNA-binding NarL/FixJ family response regulator